MIAFPCSGAKSWIDPFLSITMKAPTTMSNIDRNLTKIIVVCTVLVFSMLLKEKVAPKMKNVAIQN